MKEKECVRGNRMFITDTISEHTLQLTISFYYYIMITFYTKNIYCIVYNLFALLRCGQCVWVVNCNFSQVSISIKNIQITRCNFMTPQDIKFMIEWFFYDTLLLISLSLNF